MIPSWLLAWAAEPGPARLLAEARARAERGRLGPGSVLKVPLDAAERAAVGRLLPARWTPSGQPASVRRLRDGLAQHGVDLDDLLVAVGGPLRDRAGEAEQARLDAADARRTALAILRVLVGAPEGEDAGLDAALDAWVLRRTPALRRADDVAAVLAALPADAAVSLPVLAASVFADAHALDRSRPLGRAVVRLLAVRAAYAAGCAAPGGPLSIVDPVLTPEGWRAAWASGGVTCDGVSSQVLVLNLPLVGDAPAVAWCRATPREPVWLTLRSLEGGFRLRGARDVYVCENPSVVEAAAASGGPTRPLVCTFGRPSAAAWALLRGLEDDSHFHVRADGDATGWSIVRSLLATFPGAILWRMPEGEHRYEGELMADLLADLSAAHSDRC